MYQVRPQNPPPSEWDTNFKEIAKACGYKIVLQAEKPDEVVKSLTILKHCEGPAFLEIKIKKGSRANLGRPTTTPNENKQKFMEFLKQ